MAVVAASSASARATVGRPAITKSGWSPMSSTCCERWRGRNSVRVAAMTATRSPRASSFAFCQARAPELVQHRMADLRRLAAEQAFDAVGVADALELARCVGQAGFAQHHRQRLRGAWQRLRLRLRLAGERT
jgi:hypothetical protein